MRNVWKENAAKLKINEAREATSNEQKKFSKNKLFKKKIASKRNF